MDENNIYGINHFFKYHVCVCVCVLNINDHHYMIHVLYSLLQLVVHV